MDLSHLRDLIEAIPAKLRLTIIHDPNKFTDKYSDPGQYQGRKKRDAEADPQYFATQFVDPMTGAKGYYPVVPTTSYVQPTVQTVQPVQPQVSYVQAAPHTRTV